MPIAPEHHAAETVQSSHESVLWVQNMKLSEKWTGIKGTTILCVWFFIICQLASTVAVICKIENPRVHGASVVNEAHTSISLIEIAVVLCAADSRYAISLICRYFESFHSILWHYIQSRFIYFILWWPDLIQLDISSASARLELLRSLWKLLRMSASRAKIVSWLLRGGHAAGQCYWINGMVVPCIAFGLPWYGRNKSKSAVKRRSRKINKAKLF